MRYGALENAECKGFLFTRYLDQLLPVRCIPMWASQNDVSLLHFTVRSVRTGASFVLIKQGIFVGRNESNFGGENIELHTAPAPKDSSEDTTIASKELLTLPVGQQRCPSNSASEVPIAT